MKKIWEQFHHWLKWQVSLGKKESLTWAAQMLYCVNMASYKAISPLWPAAAQARASKTGIAYRDKELLSGSDLSRYHPTFKEKRECFQSLTISFSWLWPEWSACLTLWESKISWRNRCFPKATAPLVTIIISRPWFCSIDTCKYRT